MTNAQSLLAKTKKTTVLILSLQKILARHSRKTFTIQYRQRDSDCEIEQNDHAVPTKDALKALATMSLLLHKSNPDNRPFLRVISLMQMEFRTKKSNE